MSADRHMFPPPSSPSPPGAVEGFGGVDPQSGPPSETETLRMFVTERLAAAVDDILGEFVKTVSRYREQIDRQRRQLDGLRSEEGRRNPEEGHHMSAPCDREEVHHPSDCPLYVQQLVVSKEEVPPEQQQRSPSLDQEEPPEPPHIKEEEEELWSSQGGEQLGGLEEADITKITFSPVAVKSEDDDEEKPRSSQLHQSQTEENREDCGGSEPAGNFDPDHHEKTTQSSECDTDDTCDWEETREPQSDLNSLQNNEDPLSDEDCNTGKTPVSSSEDVPDSSQKGRLQKHSGIQTGEKLLGCSVCGKEYHLKKSLRNHMRLHSLGKRFSCSVCKKTFSWQKDVVAHMRIHTGEKPFSCSVCGTTFARRSSLTKHLSVHTGEKPFTCSVCKTSFRVRDSLVNHMRIHSEEKPFSCSVCSKRFARKTYLKLHSTVHAEEKPFHCSVCDKRFPRLDSVKKHKCAGESSRKT